MKTRTPRRLQGPSSSTATGPLSPACAFVVQFRERPTSTAQQCAGRVEHIVTGDAARFESLDELLAFFTRVLRAVQPPLAPAVQTGSSEIPHKSEEDS